MRCSSKASRKRFAENEGADRNNLKRNRTSSSGTVERLVGAVQNSSLRDADPTAPTQDIYIKLFGASQFYEERSDELSEEDLYFADEATSRDKKLPVRILRTFTFYGLQDRRILPLPPSKDVRMAASGYVRPDYEDGLYEVADDDWSEVGDDMEDVSAQWQPVKLGRICEVYLDTKAFFKPEIWVRTSKAWYILDTPSEEYQPFLELVYTPYLLTCALATKTEHDCSYEIVQRILESGGDTYVLRYAERVLGRPLSIKDFIHTEAEVREELKRLKENSLRKDVGEDDIETVPFVTEVVGSIAQGLFHKIVATTEVRATDRISSPNNKSSEHRVHEDDPKIITWGKPWNEYPGYYQAVFLDGDEYRIGDAVAVKPGQDSNQTRATNATLDSSRTANELANRAWFCIIISFQEKKVRHRETERPFHCHVRWLEHGAKTVLAETADPQELFLLDLCDEISVSAILQKIDLRRLGGQANEIGANYDRPCTQDSFFYRKKWKEDLFTLMNPSFDDEDALMGQLWIEPHQRCYPCTKKYQDSLDSTSLKSRSTSSFRIFGQEYHVHDFVYVKQSEPMLAVAQITDLLIDIGSENVQLRRFERISNLQKHVRHPSDVRLLLPTDGRFIISADCIDGRCFVRREENIADLNDWIQRDDHYFIAKGESATLKDCRRCAGMSECDGEAKAKSRWKLTAMDIFAGAGGLTTGMDMSTFVQTKWVIERSTSACRTIQKNHPDVTVYNEDCNALLRRELKGDGSPNSIDGSQRRQPLPLPGEVDIIVGGPPCQAFSGMNRYKTADDVRLTLIPTMLSYVEHYRPKYVLIENVTGLLCFQLRGKQHGYKIVDGVRAGMVKFIMRTFVALGYQVQVRVLNSADYGSPQQRNRVIFWASRFDVRLPSWPSPTHIPRNGHNNTARKVSTIGWIPRATRHPLDGSDGHEYAPSYSTTVLEALDDLPAFNWKNPCQSAEAFYDDEEEICVHADSASVPVESSVAGFDSLTCYRTAPRTPYQAWIRRGTDDRGVTKHYTGIFSPIVVRRTINIAMEGGANHESLPRSLRLRTRDGDQQKDLYRRLDGNGEFRTMMASSINPSSRGVCIIHPTQRRILTVREYARAQGFPDWYKFESVERSRARIIEDEYRQIGNAVPVPLALALAKALGNGLQQEDIDTHVSDLGSPII